MRTLLSERKAVMAAGYEQESAVVNNINQSVLKIREKLCALEDSEQE